MASAIVKKERSLPTGQVEVGLTGYQYVDQNGHRLKGRKAGSAHRIRSAPLNREECAVVEEMFVEDATITVGATWFKSMLFKDSFKVFFGSRSSDTFFPLQEEVQQKIIHTYWIPWLHNVYDRLKMHGIVPYYYKKIFLRLDGSEKTNNNQMSYHLVPICPPIGSGETRTYMDNKEQAFYWQWNNKISDPDASGLEDGSLYFIIRNEPSLDGSLRSPLKSLINQYLNINLLTQINYQTSRSLSDPLHIIEYHPDLKDAGGIVTHQGMRNPKDGNPVAGPDGYVYPPRPPSHTQTTSNLGYVTGFRENQVNGPGRTPMKDIGIPSELTGKVMGFAHYREALSGFRARGPSGSYESTLSMRYNALESLRRVKSGSPDGIDDSIEGRLATRGMSNAMLLKPFESYVSGARPVSHESGLGAALARFDSLAAAVMDFPLATLIREVVSKTSSNSSMTLLEDKLKAESAYYTDIIKTVFTLAYVPFIQKDVSDPDNEIKFEDITSTSLDDQAERRDKFLAIVNNSQVEVVLPRIPIRSFDEIAQLWQNRMIERDEFYKLAMDSAGLGRFNREPPTEFKKASDYLYPITDPPLATEFGIGGGGGGSKRKRPDSQGDTQKRQEAIRKQKITANNDDMDLDTDDRYEDAEITESQQPNKRRRINDIGQIEKSLDEIKAILKMKPSNYKTPQSPPTTSNDQNTDYEGDEVLLHSIPVQNNE